eukprot:TRINITY_DN12566_c0_g1_i1.p1 TRINITY_DN12566_c0_g1~~TRINITY_DN12566_c0_g1_i1.p1  ORF type:complete len:310 (-),score=96.29 TRINITY_DN12566_c0_g1_i1:49-864(-)
MGGNPTTFATLKGGYSFEQYMKEKIPRITKSVHVEAAAAPGESVKKEVTYVQNLANEKGWPLAIVAYANLADDNIEEQLQWYAKHPRMRGIRQQMNYHTRPDLRVAEREDYMTDPKWNQGYALLEKYNMTFDLQLWYPQMNDAIKLARAHPNINIIIDHVALPMGYLDPSQEAVDGWKAAVKAISACPNVYIKISGLAMTVDLDAWKQYVVHAVESFGPDRCVFGSNFPVDRMKGESIEKIFHLYNDALQSYSIQDRKKIFHDNAVKFYRI